MMPVIVLISVAAKKLDANKEANHIKNRVLEIFNISLEIEPTVITN